MGQFWRRPGMLAKHLGVVPTAKGKAGGRKLSRRPSWSASHKGVIEAECLQWKSEISEPPGDIKSMYPGLFDILPREYERLCLSGVRSFPERKFRLFELSQSADRTGAKDQSSCVGTIFPNAKFYCTHKCRPMLGIEEMHLQSLWFSDAVLARASDHTLKSLAGNAFEASCNAAVFFVGL